MGGRSFSGRTVSELPGVSFPFKGHNRRIEVAVAFPLKVLSCRLDVVVVVVHVVVVVVVVVVGVFAVSFLLQNCTYTNIIINEQKLINESAGIVLKRKRLTKATHKLIIHN